MLNSNNILQYQTECHTSLCINNAKGERKMLCQKQHIAEQQHNKKGNKLERGERFKDF